MKRKQAEKILQFMLEVTRASGDGVQIPEEAIRGGSKVWPWSVEWRLHDLYMAGYVDYCWTKGSFPSKKVYWLTSQGRKSMGILPNG